MSLLGLALVLFVIWALAVGAFHVSLWVVHLLVIAAVVVLIVALVEYVTGRRPL